MEPNPGGGVYSTALRGVVTVPYARVRSDAGDHLGTEESGEWLVARVITQRFGDATRALSRLGRLYYSPEYLGQPRDPKSEPPPRFLYPGYLFVRSPTWYDLLGSTSALVGVVAGQDLSPLRSRRLDEYVQSTMARRDAAGFVPAPPTRRTSFMRRDRVVLRDIPMFSGARGAILSLSRGDRSATVSLDGSGAPVTVWVSSLQHEWQVDE